MTITDVTAAGKTAVANGSAGIFSGDFAVFFSFVTLEGIWASEFGTTLVAVMQLSSTMTSPATRNT